MDAKYIRPKRRLDLRSAEAWADWVQVWVMSTWQVLHVVADWGFMVLRRSGGGVYAEAARDKTSRARHLLDGIERTRIKVTGWYPDPRKRGKERRGTRWRGS